MKRWHAVFLLAAAVCAAMGLILCREPAALPAAPERPVQTAQETRLWLREQAHRLVTEEDTEGVVLDCAAGQDGGSLAMAVLYRGSAGWPPTDANVLFAVEQDGKLSAPLRVTVGVGLPLRYLEGSFAMTEPDVLTVSFRCGGTDEIRDFRLTYSWPPEQDGPLIRSEENIRST